MNQKYLDDSSNGCQILEGTGIDGDVRCDKDIDVSGFIHGNVTGGKRVRIDGTGVVDGNVDCDELHLDGLITGNACVTCQAFLGGNAEIKGSLVAASLEIVPGVKIGLGLKLKDFRNNQID